MANKKACSNCGESKSLQDFYKAKKLKDGHMARCKPCWNVGNLDRILKRTYGISEDFYDRMREDQGGRCAICNIHESKLERRLHVDHDHKTGEIRGLLCNRCNIYIGGFEKNPSLLLVAYDYLGGE